MEPCDGVAFCVTLEVFCQAEQRLCCHSHSTLSCCPSLIRCLNAVKAAFVLVLKNDLTIHESDRILFAEHWMFLNERFVIYNKSAKVALEG